MGSAFRPGDLDSIPNLCTATRFLLYRIRIATLNKRRPNSMERPGTIIKTSHWLSDAMRVQQDDLILSYPILIRHYRNEITQPSLPRLSSDEVKSHTKNTDDRYNSHNH